MHIGRSHHTALQVIGSLIGGFAISFLTFAGSMYVQLGGMKGQLIAGNPSVNKEYPSTLNSFQGALDGSNPIASSLTSYSFWVMVTLGGIVAAFVLMKVIRRWV